MLTAAKGVVIHARQGPHVWKTTKVAVGVAGIDALSNAAFERARACSRLGEALWVVSEQSRSDLW
jgi:hypothetical protein